jgi:hypothetical protein
VFSAQLSEDTLIFAASIYYCEELLLREEGMLANKIRQ